MAKAPAPGRTMTRLTPPCSPAEAARLAAAALDDTLRTAVATPGVRTVVVLDGEAGEWLPAGCPVVAQSRGTLDDRIADAFERLGGPTMMIGADTPQLTTRDLGDAASALRGPGADAVLGPATDGGFWIIGLTRPDRAVLAGVPMSTPDTGREQRDRMKARGLRVADLREMRDVDTAADAVRVARSRPGSRFARLVSRLDLPSRVADDLHAPPRDRRGPGPDRDGGGA